MKKRYMLITLIVTIFLIALSIQNVFSQIISINTKEECELAGATWQYISPENGESYYQCICDEYKQGIQTKLWNGTSCFIVDDEIRCKQSWGKWENNSCNCLNGKWIDNIGCEYVIYSSNWYIYLIMLLLILIIILVIIIFRKRN